MPGAIPLAYMGLRHVVFYVFAHERQLYLHIAVALMKAGPGSAADLPSALLRRAQVRLTRQQSDAALQDARQADDLLQRSHGSLPSRHKGDVQMIWGQLHQAGQRPLQARTAFKEAAEQFARCLGEQHASTLQAQRLAGGEP